MPAKDLGESAKKLVISALKEVFRHEPTITRWEETKRKEETFMLPVPDDGRKELVFKQKSGIRIEFITTTMLSDKEVAVSGCCIFKTQGPPICHQPNLVLLEVGGAKKKYDFYAPSERDVFLIQGVPQT